MPSTENTVKISNVSPGDCLPLAFEVHVNYTNAIGTAGDVSVACGGATASPASQPAPNPDGHLDFTLTHGGAVSGHMLTATLTHSTAVVASDSIRSVGVGNPCPIVIGGTDGTIEGLPALNTNAALSGTFETPVGNEVILLVEEPVIINGRQMQPVLVYADPAKVRMAKNPPLTGIWEHAAIHAAKPGRHLRVVLTKEGAVKCIAHAIFK